MRTNVGALPPITCGLLDRYPTSTVQLDLDDGRAHHGVRAAEEDAEGVRLAGDGVGGLEEGDIGHLDGQTRQSRRLQRGLMAVSLPRAGGWSAEALLWGP